MIYLLKDLANNSELLLDLDDSGDEVDFGSPYNVADEALLLSEAYGMERGACF